MGDFNIKSINNHAERSEFYHLMLKDLKAFDILLKEGIVEQKSDTIGAEQELCLIDKRGYPTSTALNILKDIKDPNYTNELALYNLEINLSPQKLNGKCFSYSENELHNSIARGRSVAQIYDTDIFLAGILPTINFRHLSFEYMTPEERYKVLSNELLRLRGTHFEIFLQGVDDFHATLNSVLFEACNTSFQLHLQIDPREFDAMHNWAQMISGPILAACTNSPLLFGKELWAENRIALFKQSLDTRALKNHSLNMMPRVYFGKEWMEGSPIQLWQKDVVSFPTILRGEGAPDPVELINQGIAPTLKHIRLHNGTTYTWNRLCYGVHENIPHIRIECRYLPAGPTFIDEMANFALWIGVMKGMPEQYREFWKELPFEIAKSNFIKGARYGLQSMHYWMDRYYCTNELISSILLPIAYNGLHKMGVDSDDAHRLLNVIDQRMSRQRNGSTWQIYNFRKLKKKYKPSIVCQILTKEMLDRQKEDIPVHEWHDLNIGNNYYQSLIKPADLLVEDVMNRDVISIKEYSTVEVAKAVLEWEKFHHLPVEDVKGNLTGIISQTLLDTCQDDLTIISDIMVRDIISVKPNDTYLYAINLMEEKNVGSLIVKEEDKLIGIITQSDKVS